MTHRAESLVPRFPVPIRGGRRRSPDDHCERIWKALHKRGAADDAMDDLMQDCVESFLVCARENGMPVNLPAKLQSLAGGLIWNHLRGERYPTRWYVDS